MQNQRINYSQTKKLVLRLSPTALCLRVQIPAFPPNLSVFIKPPDPHLSQRDELNGCRDFARLLSPSQQLYHTPPPKANTRARASQVFLLIRLKQPNSSALSFAFLTIAKLSLAKRQKPAEVAQGHCSARGTVHVCGLCSRGCCSYWGKGTGSPDAQGHPGPYTATPVNCWHSRKCKGPFWQLQLKPEAQKKKKKKCPFAKLQSVEFSLIPNDCVH